MQRIIFPLLILLTLAACWRDAPTVRTARWLAPDTTIVLDAFHGNTLDLAQVATDPKVGAILHKATEGEDFSDPAYAARRRAARAAGFLWGSYHLFTTSDTPAQVSHYLLQTGIHADETYALDVECLDGVGTCGNARYAVTIDAIKSALRLTKEATGEFPLLYCNHVVKSVLAKALAKDPEFADVKLWYARFRSDVSPFFPDKMWQTYTLWQFSSEINCDPAPGACPYRVPGTEDDMDLNIWNGTPGQLAAQWPIHH